MQNMHLMNKIIQEKERNKIGSTMYVLKTAVFSLVGGQICICLSWRIIIAKYQQQREQIIFILCYTKCL